MTSEAKQSNFQVVNPPCEKPVTCTRFASTSGDATSCRIMDSNFGACTFGIHQVNS